MICCVTQINANKSNPKTCSNKVTQRSANMLIFSRLVKMNALKIDFHLNRWIDHLKNNILILTKHLNVVIVQYNCSNFIRNRYKYKAKYRRDWCWDNQTAVSLDEDFYFDIYNLTNSVFANPMILFNQDPNIKQSK